MTDEELVHRILRIWCQYDLAHDDLLWVAHIGDDAHFSVDCSDTFAWGEADSEPITEKNVGLLEELVSENLPAESDWALRLWCCIQRGECPMKLRMQLAPKWFREEVERRWPVPIAECPVCGEPVTTTSGHFAVCPEGNA